MIVVDASLAAKWVLWEEDSEDAVRFFRRFGGQFQAPELMLVEVASAIVRRANMIKDIEKAAFASLDRWSAYWMDGAVETVALAPDHLTSAGRLGIMIGHPLKDCIYLALAMELSCPLVTCDAKFQAKARPLYPDVHLMKEFLGNAPPA